VSSESNDATGAITDLLKQWSLGDRSALDRVLPLVYHELRTIAARQIQRRDSDGSVDPTDLVHGLYLQLVNQRHATWLNRSQFFAVVAHMMRRILVDHARAQVANKRGGQTVTISLTALPDDPQVDSMTICDVLSVDRALERLAARDSEQARIVELRFFVGLSIEETAHILGRSPATVKRSWRVAKAWLFRELRLSDGG
jgi:RNA polymerase sigma factor (TIGR02999 family)